MVQTCVKEDAVPGSPHAEHRLALRVLDTKKPEAGLRNGFRYKSDFTRLQDDNSVERNEAE